MKKIKNYEIINHGYEHSQYFQGCGTSYTKFNDVATGIGMDAKEAYDDAVEGLAFCSWDVSTLPTRPNGIRKRDKVPAKFLKNEYNEIYWYVSIRVK
jgi:hypothetical protein